MRGEQGLLGAGVQRFAAHDQPGAFGPVGQVDEVGELGHRRAVAFVAVLARAGCQASSSTRDPADGRVNAGVGAGHDREADVAGPALATRSRCSRPSRPAPAPPGAPGPDRHRRGGPTAISRAAGRSPRRARRRDRRCCSPRRCPAAAAPPASRRWRRRSSRSGGTRTRPCSSGPCPALFSEWISMQRRVDVQHHRWPLPVVADDRRHTFARTSAIASHNPARVTASIAAERAIQRRVRRHRPEQRRLRAEMLDVRARLTAAGQHQHRLGQHLAPVMQREPLTA